MKIPTSGIELAKNVFRVLGVDVRSHFVFFCKNIRRYLLALFMFCWSLVSAWLGGILPQFVKPYVKSDDDDTEAICEAVPRPSMRFVPIKM